MSILSKASLVQIPSGYGENKLYSEVPNTTAGDFTFTRASTGTRVNNLGHIEDVSWNLQKYSEELTGANGWRQDLGLTTQLTTETNPIGVDSCYKTIADTNTNNHYTFSTNAIGNLSSYGGFCVSFYAKPNGYNWIRYWNNNIQLGVDINIVTGEIENKRHESIRTILIEDAPNGWTKVSLQFDRLISYSYAMLKPMPTALGTNTFAGDGVSGMFLWGIQISKGLNFKTYIKTTDGFDVPRLDYTGAVSTSTLIENQYANSENFANATWQKNSVSIVSNTTTSPVGDLTADTLDFAANGFLKYYQVQGAGMLSEAFTFSIYVKYNNSSFMQFIGDGDVDHYANFDIQNGILGTNIGSETTASITDVGSGWYRLSITCATGTFNINSSIRFRSTTQLDSNWYANGTAGGNYYIWGAMLQYKTTLGSYVKTEGSLLDYYVFQYSSGTTCPTLLLEPQKTNEVTYSEDYSSGSWVKSNTTTIANDTISPRGTQDASKIHPNSSGNYRHIRNNSFNPSSGLYTFSIFAKAGELDHLVLIDYDGSGIGIDFDLTNGVATDNATSPFDSFSMTDVGDGWYRCVATATDMYFYWILSDNGGLSVTANGTDGLYIWGAMAETGSFPTSYIPTTGTSVTRVADVSETSGLSDYIGQSEGSFILDFKCPSGGGGQIYIWDGTLQNRILLNFYSSNTRIDVLAVVGNTLVANENLFDQDTTQRTIYGIRYRENDFEVWVNGVLKATESGTFTFWGAGTLDQLDFNAYNDTAKFSGNVNKVIFTTTYPTDDEMEQLTTIL